VLTNSTASFTAGTAIVAGRDGLELKETMILCGRAAQTTHIKSIAVFFHPMEQIEVAFGKFNMVTTEAEFTRVESELSFLQVRSTMTHDMRGSEADCAHEAGEHRQGGESLQSDAGLRERTPGHSQWCDGVRDEVSGGGGAAEDSHQLHQRDSSDPVRCNDVAPPRWRLNGRWYCAFPEIRDCAEPGKIPMKPIAIDDIKVVNLGLGRSIYSPAQLEEFARFQES
jgi:hypothetical protein